jgi:hypothetical protein
MFKIILLFTVFFQVSFAKTGTPKIKRDFEDMPYSLYKEYLDSCLTGLTEEELRNPIFKKYCECKIQYIYENYSNKELSEILNSSVKVVKQFEEKRDNFCLEKVSN